MTAPQPGDLDRMRWAVAESADISTSGVIEHSGLPWNRARAALDALLERGDVTCEEGHTHGDSDLCCCPRGGVPVTHWYNRGAP